MTIEVVGTRAGKMADAVAASGSPVCVGLDPETDTSFIPDVFEFNRAIIDATHDLVAAYKPQLAFYEARGLEGHEALNKTIDYIRIVAPEVFVIGDAKRGDTGNTAAAYAKAMFESWEFDATTVHLYQGVETLEPFLEYEGKFVFVCCRTSNDSSVDVQDKVDPETGKTVYETVAELSVDAGRNKPCEVGLVVGATFPQELGDLRDAYPSTPFLIPGVGAQGGDAAETAILGRGNFLINSSRGVIFASRSKHDFQDKAREAVIRLRDEIAFATS